MYARKVCLSGGVIFVLAAACLGQTLPAGEVISRIEVRGNERMSETAVLSYVRSRAGQDFDEKLIKADEQRLLQSGKFDTVLTEIVPTDKGVAVTFVVRERPLVEQLTFAGNRKFKDAELAKEVPFAPGDPVDRYLIEAGRQAIVQIYHDKGFHDASVTYDEAALATHRQVHYQIVQGPQVIVRKVRFKGNRSFSSWTLGAKTETSARFWPFVEGYYNPDQVQQDVVNLRNFYWAEGYLDAEVARELEFSADKTRLANTFIVCEGARYRVNELKFSGNTVFSDAELARRLALDRGEPYTALKLQRATKRLEDTYGELGYVYADIEARREYPSPDAPLPAWASQADARPALVNLVFDITERDQYRLGRIDIRGNSVTASNVVRRELRFFPEQLYNAAAVEESRRRLIETRLFQRVDITPTGNDPAVRDALVQVEETGTGQVSFSLAVNSDSGLLGGVTYAERNFDLFRWPGSWSDVVRHQPRRAWRGAGQTFSITAEPGTELMRFSVNWFEPALFDKPYSLGTKAYLFGRGRETYDETRWGGVVSQGHRFANGWYGELAEKIEGVEIDNLDADAPPEVVRDAGTAGLFSVQASLVRDRTDSRWLPSAGDRLKFSYEQTMGDYTFGTASGEYQIYRTVHVDALDRKHILAARAIVGHVFGTAPVYEKFYGGGINSLRGFDYRGISPRSRGTDEPIGGDFLAVAGVEYTFPVIGDQIRGVLFVDTGTVERKFEVTTWRVAPGFGLRWVVPLLGPVPMSLDFAFPIIRDDEDDERVFSFSAGWTF